MSGFSPLVLERLMLYHRFITDRWDPDDPGAVTSSEIAASLDVDPTQVRKDLGAVGVRGKGRVGYAARDVVSAIRSVLGFEETHLAILIGAGSLGRALVAYRNFARYGLRFVAAFDVDPSKVGEDVGGCPIRHMDDVEEFIDRHRIRLAVLTVPGGVAQEISDRLVVAGVEAIWNFAPTRLAVPTAVRLRNEHLSLGFAQLSHFLARAGSPPSKR